MEVLVLALLQRTAAELVVVTPQIMLKIRRLLQHKTKPFGTQLHDYRPQTTTTQSTLCNTGSYTKLSTAL